MPRNDLQGIFLIERIAWMYYMVGMNQEKIAKTFNISKSKVSRLLKKAEKLGIAEVRLNLRNRVYYPELELQLREVFDLVDCFVIPSSGQVDDGFFYATAAQYAEEVIKPGDMIGVAWGQTLHRVFSYIDQHRDFSTVTVVQLLGGLAAAEPSWNVYDITKFFRNAKCLYLYSPAIVSCPETRRYLMREPAIKRVFEAMNRVNKAFLGIGDVSEECSLFKAGFLNAEQLIELVQRGAIGDVVGRFFNIEGEPIRWDVDDRIIGITLEQLKNIPLRIAVATGKRKVKPILGALRRHYINALVTDYETAREVLEFVRMSVKTL